MPTPTTPQQASLPQFEMTTIDFLIPNGSISKARFYLLWSIFLSSIGVAVVTYVAWPYLTYEKIMAMANPAVLGTLTLLIGLLTRNASISDRIRMLGKEVNEARSNETAPSLVSERLICVRKQIEDFSRRYVLNIGSLIAITLNLFLIPLIFFSIPKESVQNVNERQQLTQQDKDDTNQGNEVLDKSVPKPEPNKENSNTTISSVTLLFLGLSSTLFSVAGVAFIFDILLSVKTLKTDAKFSFDEITKLTQEKDKIAEGELSAVVHFSQQFHELWYRDRLQVMRISREDEDQVRAIKEFFCKYIGLQQEQYDFAKNGLLPKTLFTRWVMFLRNQAIDFPGPSGLGDKVDFCGQSLREWWKENRGSYKSRGFQKFIDHVMLVNSEPNKGRRFYSVKKLVEKMFPS